MYVLGFSSTDRQCSTSREMKESSKMFSFNSQQSCQFECSLEYVRNSYLTLTIQGVYFKVTFCRVPLNQKRLDLHKI